MREMSFSIDENRWQCRGKVAAGVVPAAVVPARAASAIFSILLSLLILTVALPGTLVAQGKLGAVRNEVRTEKKSSGKKRDRSKHECDHDDDDDDDDDLASALIGGFIRGLFSSNDDDDDDNRTSVRHGPSVGFRRDPHCPNKADPLIGYTVITSVGDPTGRPYPNANPGYNPGTASVSGSSSVGRVPEQRPHSPDLPRWEDNVVLNTVPPPTTAPTSGSRGIPMPTGTRGS